MSLYWVSFLWLSQRHIEFNPSFTIWLSISVTKKVFNHQQFAPTNPGIIPIKLFTKLSCSKLVRSSQILMFLSAVFFTQMGSTPRICWQFDSKQSYKLEVTDSEINSQMWLVMMVKILFYKPLREKRFEYKIPSINNLRGCGSKKIFFCSKNIFYSFELFKG